MNTPGRIVIVGAGHAGAQTAIALRDHGYSGEVTVIGDETSAPYNRPPLSKAYLKSPEALEVLVRPASFWSEHGVDLRLGSAATAIDRVTREIRVGTVDPVPFDSLVLATGARPRVLPDVRGLPMLRTDSDAQALRTALRPGLQLVLVGAGYIGLELAATATQLDAKVTVVEAAPSLLARTLSRTTASYLQEVHEKAGVRFVLGQAPTAVTHKSVSLPSGETLHGDLVVIGIGVIPNTELALDCRLEVGDGIEVDKFLRTSDPDIYAIGDCASFPCPVTGRRVRLESVQNGTDQARHVARTLLGQTEAGYAAVPCFWTDQHGRKLMIAGVSSPEDRVEVTGSVAEESFSVRRYDAADRLTSVESINAVQDHVRARKALAARAM